jgi:AraC-like DNA-binding protein
MQAMDDVAQGFRASNEVWDLGSMVLSRVTAPALHVQRSAAQIRRDQIDTWFLACARRGVVRHSSAGMSSTVEFGVPILYSMGEPFESTRSDIEWVALFFSRDFCRELNAPLGLARNSPMPTSLGRLLADFMLSLDRQLPCLTVDDLPRVGAIIHQMLAACIAPTADRLAEAAPALDQTRRERVRLAIRRHMGLASLTPDRLCRLVGMSRSSLYRLFESEGGVAAYIMRQRLHTAHAALCDPKNMASVRSVAESVGIVDPSSFSRSFRQEFGYSPRDLRQFAEAHAAAGIANRALAPSEIATLLRRL